MIRTILFGLDGSGRSTGVFEAAVELARAMGSRLVLYRSLVPPDMSSARSILRGGSTRVDRSSRGTSALAIA